MSSSTSCVLDMKSFQQLCVAFSPNIPVMVRGRHGIGKSQAVYQIAEKLGLPVVERRLSQLTEGDMVGLPTMEGEFTQFKPVDWLMRATREPVVLFLDELNRALKGVEQATFQLADSRAFYGHKLHPETRIFIAVNIGDAYNVENFDAAAISRYAVIDLEPEVEDWIEWAQKHCHVNTWAFIKSNPKLLEEKGMHEPNRKYPDRRAWARLDAELQRPLEDGSTLMDNPRNPVFRWMCSSLLGIEASNSFVKYCAEISKDVSAEDVLSDWTLVKARVGQGLTQMKYAEIGDKLSVYFTNVKSKLSEPQLKELVKFFQDCHAEPMSALLQKIAQENRTLMIRLQCPELRDRILEVTTGGDKRKKNVVPGAASPAKT